MRRRIFKWTGIILLSIVALFAAGYGIIAININNRSAKFYRFERKILDIKQDSLTLSKGKHLVAIKGCQDCHGKDLAGKIMINDGAVGRISATNLTKGKGGLPIDYNDQDWITALRHGVDRNGRPLILMPSHETTLLSEHDMAAIIAYCKNIPAVTNELPPIELGPVANVMSFFDKMPLLSVEKIDHAKPMIIQADTVVGVKQGEYLAVSCSGCHRADFKGGDPLAPGLPPVPDITSGGNLGKWTQQQFLQTLRTGKTPAGHQMSNADMPWQMTAQYSDDELVSLYEFFQSKI
ncbi:cytochrome c [Dyadobacter sp. CY345]|uniref:cytochrome c n=1 Tax=Dyadobacter sp. CY345 TaxID=2909335 RepID=UPI001F17D1D2|nr:cytochrome c [Dyadobacter sp. CY345]MCF2446827.1 cytochrome c [Dyadobacter sp. CY345]